MANALRESGIHGRGYKTPEGGKLILETYDRLLDAWNIEKEEIYADTSYGRTHIAAAGAQDNPPLLLFHGVGDDSALMWLYNAAPLSADFRIYAIDTMGCQALGVSSQIF